MKKLNRFIAVAVVMIMMCMLLCSCSTLDTMKEQHAYWTNENSIDSITLSNGDEYIRIENSSEIMLNQNTWFPIYVTTKDVPVLLSNEYGVCLSQSDHRDFLYGYIEEDIETIFSDNKKFTIDEPTGAVYESATFVGDASVHTDTVGDVLYCKKEIYDDITKRLEEGVEYTHYGYEYFTYDKETFLDKQNYYYLSSDEAKVIDKIFEEVKPHFDEQVIYDSYSMCYLYNLSDDHIFGKEICEIYVSPDGKTYYLAKYFEGVDKYDVYEVPEKYNDDMKKITKDAESTLNIYYDTWSDDKSYDGT